MSEVHLYACGITPHLRTSIGETAKTGLSQGTVAGIAVAAIIAMLSALIVVYGLWKRRQRHIKVFEHKDGSIDGPDLPTAALRTSPFTSRPDLSEVVPSPENGGRIAVR